MKAELVYGVDQSTGELRHISSVERGLACNCVCPNCSALLVAKQGKLITHHFAHHAGDDCGKAVESATHLAAKRALESAAYLRLPAVYVKFDSYREPALLSNEKDISIDYVESEKRKGNLVPDLVVHSGGVPLIVEIWVTHKVDELKLKKIRRLGISAIEINLTANLHNPKDLCSSVVHGTHEKSWLFNAKADKIKQLFLRTGTRKQTVHRGFALHVDGCPLPARKWKGKPYANVVDDCSDCPYCLEMGWNMSHVVCGGENKVVTLEELRKFYGD